MTANGHSTDVSASLPLYVDLDGTVVHTDLLMECALQILRTRPWNLVAVPIWLIHGRAYLKCRIAALGQVNVAALPYNHALIAHLERERERGRCLVLATGTSSILAEQVAQHLGLFSRVLASTSAVNLTGQTKLGAICADSGGRFAYAGNSADDLPIWQRSAAAILVGVKQRVASRLPRELPIEAVFQRAPAWRDLITLLRPHHWLKNILVFLPLVPIAPRATEAMIVNATLAFVAFSVCASSGYVVNDLLDLDADRSHSTKRNRPLAAGRISIQSAVALASGMALSAAILALILPTAFGIVLLLYLAGTLLYSFKIKKYPLLDVVTLAWLYVLRVLGGAAAIDVPPSFWVLAFSFFAFVSLALAKRYSELLTATQTGHQRTERRGYLSTDLTFVQVTGIAAGQGAVVVMALYVNDPETISRYSDPVLLWALCPLLLIWIGRVWLFAGRGGLHEDPLVFALKDRLCLLVSATAVFVILGALLPAPSDWWILVHH